MPVKKPDNFTQIDILLLEKLNKFIEENYIPPEQVPLNIHYLSTQNDKNLKQTEDNK